MSVDNGEKASIGRRLSELSSYNGDDPNELLQYRFLCREGILVLNGSTGIGKSSLLMQCLILWALGREAFGIKPKKPLKSVLIQAENDDGDIAEMRDGVVEGLCLTPDETKQAGDNIIVIHDDSHVGIDFFSTTVGPALEQHKPDLLCIDPALQYLGGDTLSQKDVGTFLRSYLKPLLTRYQCAGIILHHTNKSGNNDTAYGGSGSGEWANAPRAILALNQKGKDGVSYELRATKRGERLRWKMADGITKTTSKVLKHSIEEGQICWMESDNCVESDTLATLENRQSQQEQVLGINELQIPLDKNTVIRIVKTKLGIGINKAKTLISEMVIAGQLIQTEKPRPNARPELLIQVPKDLSKVVTDV